MYKLVLACLLAVTAAAPLEDNPEVVAAKASFKAAFDVAKAGEHIALAPVNTDTQAAQISNAYLEDVVEVAAAKASFKAAFDVAKAGEHIALAPVNTDIQAAQISNAYLEDVVEVAAAKAAFDAEFKSAAAGGLAAKQAPAPVHEVAVPAPLAVSPVVYQHAYPHAYSAYPYATYAHSAYPYAAYPYANYAANPYHAAGYGYYSGYPMVVPAVAQAVDAEE